MEVGAKLFLSMAFVKKIVYFDFQYRLYNINHSTRPLV